MHSVIVFNHPYEGSFCNAVLKSATRGLTQGNNTADLIHLDNENFNPVMTAADLKAFKERKAVDPKVTEYKQRLDKADHLVFIFPIWWELMPALMKGFIDKVIFPGVAYDYTPKGRMTPLFPNIRRVTMITTMNTPAFFYRLIFGNAIRKAVITGTFWKTGYKKRKWINLSSVKSASDQRRKKWLQEIEERFSKLS